MKIIDRCRICGNRNLVSVIDLGELCFTGIFPKSVDEVVPTGRLELVKCYGKEFCGLLQLKHSFDLGLLYGENYGYRSGLNPSMVKHLSKLVNKTTKIVNLEDNDLIIDIGSNDGTLLSFFPADKFELIGIDPTGEKFKNFYREDIKLITSFFSLDSVKRITNKKAKIITSVAMFYDLEDPLNFMREIYELLSDNGIWLFEQSYTPKMILSGAYDAICHEHLDYYCLKQIKWMTDKVGFKIVDLEFNDINGGSFCIVVSKTGKESDKLGKYLSIESSLGLDTIERFNSFEKKVKEHKTKLNELLNNLKKNEKKVIGYGASTKGNVVLQYCGINDSILPYIAEVNPDKYGRFTPGTKIRIISEEEAKKINPEYLLILPWHFRKFIIEKEKKFLEKGGKLIFPLPELEIFEL